MNKGFLLKSPAPIISVISALYLLSIVDKAASDFAPYYVDWVNGQLFNCENCISDQPIAANGSLLLHVQCIGEFCENPWPALKVETTQGEEVKGGFSMIAQEATEYSGDVNITHMYIIWRPTEEFEAETDYRLWMHSGDPTADPKGPGSEELLFHTEEADSVSAFVGVTSRLINAEVGVGDTVCCLGEVFEEICEPSRRAMLPYVEVNWEEGPYERSFLYRWTLLEPAGTGEPFGWRDWRPFPEVFHFDGMAEEYCVEIEAWSSIDGKEYSTGPVCHTGELLFDEWEADLSDFINNCQKPPEGYEERWCKLQYDKCKEQATDYYCERANEYCADYPADRQNPIATNNIEKTSIDSNANIENTSDEQNAYDDDEADTREGVASNTVDPDNDDADANSKRTHTYGCTVQRVGTIRDAHIWSVLITSILFFVLVRIANYKTYQ